MGPLYERHVTDEGMQDVLDHIGPTAEVVKGIRSRCNFKAGGGEREIRLKKTEGPAWLSFRWCAIMPVMRQKEGCAVAMENGEWIMRGLRWDDPYRIRSWQELIRWIDEIGFLPLFKNEIDSFSVEEHTFGPCWWSGDPEQDPWEWRQLIARSGQAAYGKFFGRKAGFISREWFPRFANWRRDGYDFDSRWDEELAGIRQKRVMDQFAGRDELYSFQLKRLAGFGREGEKNFEGTVTDLQMSSYLLIRDFRQRLNKKGRPYGWPISVYSMPEALWGYAHIASAYWEEPARSGELVCAQVRRHFPAATEDTLRAVLGWER